MKKILLLATFSLLWSAQSIAATINCKFKPVITKVGETGANEGKFFACVSSSECYFLGLTNDEPAKSRYSTAMSALVADKELNLRFYNVADCEVARTDMNLPTSTWLIK
jgi:hypothetical protein